MPTVYVKHVSPKGQLKTPILGIADMNNDPLTRSKAPLLLDIPLKTICISNVLLHLQTQAAKRLGRGPCASKGRDRCGCRVQAIVMLDSSCQSPQIQRLRYLNGLPACPFQLQGHSGSVD